MLLLQFLMMMMVICMGNHGLVKTNQGDFLLSKKRLLQFLHLTNLQWFSSFTHQSKSSRKFFDWNIVLTFWSIFLTNTLKQHLRFLSLWPCAFAAQENLETNKQLEQLTQEIFQLQKLLPKTKKISFTKKKSSFYTVW